jgi:hypothetical protein
VNPDVRSALLAAGLAFCVLFAGATLVAIAESGPSGRGLFLGALSLGIVALIGFGLYGAMKNPPGGG